MSEDHRLDLDLRGHPVNGLDSVEESNATGADRTPLHLAERGFVSV